MMKNLDLTLGVTSFAKLSLALTAMFLVIAPLAHGAPASNPKTFEVDETWGGTRTHIGAVSVGPLVYIAYYDANRELSVAQLDTRSGISKKKKLTSIFKGWDAHNSIDLVYDKDGLVHVAGNMHSSPLVYAKMSRPNDFDSLVSTNEMVGRQENRVTYPVFFRFKDGALGFTYRFGESGNGVEIVNRFNGKKWTRLTDTPIFGSVDKGPKVNAYHSGYVVGPDGAFHTAWVWRSDRKVETNFNVNYARSNDLLNWVDSRGRPVSLPMTPENTAVVVDQIAHGSGLFNNVRVGFDRDGVPIVSYVKHDKDGFTQVYHGRPNKDGWQLSKVTSFAHRWQFGGTGTLPEKISFSGVRASGSTVSEDIKHWQEGSSTLRFDPTGMLVLETAAKKGVPGRACKGLKPWVQAENEIKPMHAGSFQGTVVWRTLPRNNDKARTCESEGLVAGCKMTSKLLVIPAEGQGRGSLPLVACNKG